jgi:nickel-dependent lactate racemase
MDMPPLAYGSQDLYLPELENADILSCREPEYSIDKKAFQDDLRALLCSAAEKNMSTAVVVADKTRLCGYDTFLPWLAEVLKECGAEPQAVTFYIAYGTHLKQSEAESIAAYGEIYRSYPFVHHDCRDESAFTSIGMTRRGTDIRIRRSLFSHSRIITFGAVSHHYFAGFGGGRKLIFPGLAEKGAIDHNHRLFLDFENNRLHPGCRPGHLDGNPVAEDLAEIRGNLPELISIHGILDSRGRVCALRTGTSYRDFLRVCKAHDGYYRSLSKKRYDIVIASVGGFPKDINYIQSHKALHNAAAFVRDGGELILFAECRDGIGTPSFLSLFNGGIGALFDAMKKQYRGNGGTAVATMEKSRRIKISMVTELTEEDCRTMGMRKIDVREAADRIREQAGTQAAEAAFIPNASMLIG